MFTTLHGAFDAQAASMGHRLAVADGTGRTLTYEELRSASDRVAMNLRLRDVQSGDRVIVKMDRSIDLIVTMLGVLKTGAVFVPIDTMESDARFMKQLDDSSPRLVITSSRVEPSVARGIMVVDYDELHDETPLVDTDESCPIAYVIYTSGSTGAPKGVVVSHTEALNHFNALSSELNLSANDRLLQFMSIGFDAALDEIFPGLFVGSQVVVRGAQLWGWQDLLAFIDRFAITVLQLPTAYWRALAAEAPPGSPQPSTIRLVIVGGEEMDVEHVSLWRKTPLGPARLVNGYGPTEAVITATLYDVPDLPSAYEGSIPIGRPFGPHTAIVLSDDAEVVRSAGETGELFLGGCLAEGYLNDSELTDSRFVMIAGRGTPRRMYRTGDRVRVLDGGNLQFISRCDQQVKISGFRVEPGEVENALRQLPDLLDAVVIPVRHLGDTRLAGFLVTNKDSKMPSGHLDHTSAAKLRNALATQLPRYMIPTLYFRQETLPVTPRGKIDRDALHHIASTMLAESSLDRSSSFTSSKDAIKHIWRYVLGVSHLAGTEDFFDLGGTSLAAARITSHLVTTLGLSVTVQEVLDFPLLSDFLELIEDRPKDSGVPSLRRVSRDQLTGFDPSSSEREPLKKPKPLTSGIPLSHQQRAVWLLHELHPESAQYNVPFACEITGALDRSCLHRATKRLVEDNEVLRTRFGQVQGRPVQILDESTLWHDDLLISLTLGSHHLDSLLVEAASKPFDLTRPPLLRFFLVQISETRNILLLVAHHIVCDGWSMPLAMEKLGVLYSSAAKEESGPQKEKQIDYTDFVAWQLRYLNRERLDRLVSFWEEELRDVPPYLEFPAWMRPPAGTTRIARKQVMSLSTSVVTPLERVARAEGATSYMAFLACLQLTIWKVTSSLDAPVGVPYANREPPEVENLIGFFANTVVQRAQLRGQPTWIEVLRRTRHHVLRSFEYRHAPFPSVVERLRPRRILGRNPLFQVALTFHNTPTAGFFGPGLAVDPVHVGFSNAICDLTLQVTEESDKLRVEIDYLSDLLTDGAVKYVADTLSSVVATVARNPGMPIECI